MTEARRELSLADAVGIGVNGIVGSGIYLLVGPLARVGGGASVFGVLACGALCVSIALCFAELSSMYDRSGGPYVYARDAFGPVVGFGVGWLGMATGVLGLAAVASGFAGALTRLLPALVPLRPFVAAALIAALGLVNYLGVKKGGRTSTVLSIAKIVPLLLVALAGLRFAPRAELRWQTEGVVSAAFLSIFMMSGFEYAAVPAGEVRDARRNVPIAIVGSIAGASLLYALLQLATLGALPDAFAREQPLPDVAARVLGPWAGPILGGTAVISMLGFCAGVALVAPRYFTALAEDGYLPAVLAARSRFGTPSAAILAASALACALSIALGYVALVDVSNVVILSGYALTCLATLVLRVRRPRAERRIRLPLGLPVLATVAAVSLLAAARPRLAEWTFSLVLLVAGFSAWALTALARRARSQKPAAAAPP